MNYEDVIRMAREAGLLKEWMVLRPEDVGTLKSFHDIAIAAEREACAKVCDELHWPWHMGDNSGPKECAAAIRARGQA